MKHSQRNSSLTSFKLLVATLLFSLISVFSAFGEIPLAKNGRADAEIIIRPNADAVLKYAASELSHWIKEISGAQLKVLNKSGNARYKILLQVNPKGFPEDLKKLKGNDGYAVRQKGNTVYLFASCSKGVLNGVYRLLFKNSDIIWARPNTKFGTIYSKNPNLALTKTDYLDVPVYIQRGWQLHPYAHVPSEEWLARNCSNWSIVGVTQCENKKWRKRWAKYGFSNEYGGGHNIAGLYIQEKKYYAKHPDFFPFKKGKRLNFSECKMGVQLCFSNPDMLKSFIKELDMRIKNNPDYETFRIMIEDNYNSCECKNCMKPIKLANGKTITHKHKAFRSTQFFMFLNKIARYMKKHYPEKRILTMAYFFTEIPPMCRLEPNIGLTLCLIYRDGKAPLNTKKNKKSNDNLKGWVKVTKNVVFREYYGLAPAFPRPLDAHAIADWQYVNKTYGLDRTYSQMYGDGIGHLTQGIKVWNFNSMYFWVLANGPWNPYLGVKALRTEFLKRVYGPAAEDVRKFYRLIEVNWLKDEAKSFWDDRTYVLWNSVVRKNKLEKQCRKLLEQAALKVNHPKGKKMLAELRATFEEKVADEAKLKITRVKKAPEFAPDFNSGDWEKAQVVDNFFTKAEQPARVKTEVRALYDKNNLYLGIRCFDKNSKKTFCENKKLAHNKWSRGKKIELFITGVSKDNKTDIYQVTLDFKGNIFDSLNRRSKWNFKFKHQQKLTPTGWSAMLTIPFKTLNVNINKKPDIRIMFIRYHFWMKNGKKKTRDISYWNKGAVHNYYGFGRIIF